MKEREGQGAPWPAVSRTVYIRAPRVRGFLGGLRFPLTEGYKARAPCRRQFTLAPL